MPVMTSHRRATARRLPPSDAAPNMLLAGPDGEIRTTSLTALGRSGTAVCPVDDWLPMPAGAQLLTMPDCRPVGLRAGAPVTVTDGLPVAVALPHGYTRTYLPAYVKEDGAPSLPLFGYTAVADRDGELVVAAVQTDDAPEWRPAAFGTPDLAERIAALQRELPA